MRDEMRDEPAVTLATHGYGKDGIRIVTRAETGGVQTVRDLTLDLRITGDFSPAYLDGDNSTTLPTDAMRNHAWAVAADLPAAEAEVVGAAVVERLLGSIAAASTAEASITLHPWIPLPGSGESAFVAASWVGHAGVRADRSGTRTTGGFGALTLLRPFGSDFAGFLRDELTDQPDAVNRVLAGTVDATWRYRGPVESYCAVRDRARTAIADAFRARPSPAIQRTVYEMAAAALEAAPEIDDVTVVFSSRPHAPALPPGRAHDPAEPVWSAAAGPLGVTEATVRRS